MATPTINVNTRLSLAFAFWGNLLGVYSSLANISINKLSLTNNGSAPHSTAELENITISLSRNPVSLAFATPGSQDVTITSNCAWKLTYSGSAVFIIGFATGNATLSGSSPTGVFGGNGSFTVGRNGTSSPGATGTVTITFSNGLGGSTTLTVTLSTTF